MRSVSKSISNGSSTLAVSNGTMPTIVRSGSVGRRGQGDLDRALAALVALDVELHGVARLLPRQGGDEVVHGVQRHAVEAEQGVARLEDLGRRGLGRATAVFGRFEAHDLADDDVAVADRGVVVAERTEGHVLGDLARGPHHLQRDAPLLGAGPGPEQLLVGEEVDRRFGRALRDHVAAATAGDPPRQDRLRRVGDGDEVDVALTVLVDLGDALQGPERHTVVDRRRRARGAGVEGGPLDRRPRDVGIGDLLAGDQAGRQQRGHRHRGQDEEGEDGERHGPDPVPAARRPDHAPHRRGSRR